MERGQKNLLCRKADETIWRWLEKGQAAPGAATRLFRHLVSSRQDWRSGQEERPHWHRCRPVQTGTDKSGNPQITPAKPWLDGLPRLIFISDMSDALSADVPFEYLRTEIVQGVSSPKGKRHCWLWLTKRPDRMADFSTWLAKQGIDWPANLWVGTSITTQATLKRAKQLLDVGDDRTIRFLSIEPQWEAITLGDLLPRLNWVIQGGESGNSATPFAIEWADRLCAECQAAGVPYFLKQLGSNVTEQGKRITFENWEGGDWNEWPTRFRLRQLPRVPRAMSRFALRRRFPSCGMTRQRCTRTDAQNSG